MISFIIPAHNESRHIEATVRSVIACAGALGREYEIVVVADACTDGTAALAQAAGVRVVEVHHRHIAATRNSGARAARGQQFIFIDADTQLNEQVLRKAVAALDRGVVGGGAGVTFDGKVGLTALAFLHTWNMLARIIRWAAGCFVFVQRDAFEAVGGFDERYFISEEVVLSLALKRLGPFCILNERVVTSARKMHMYPLRKWLPHVLRLMLSGPAVFRNREGLWMWYEGKRE